jgi:hypothetical protein
MSKEVSDVKTYTVEANIKFYCGSALNHQGLQGI